MCVGFWTLHHPEYALPTTPAHFHSFGDLDEQNGDVLSGRDNLAGGSWLGVNRKSGRIVLLTNITEQKPKVSSSRGHLVSSFLTASSSEPLTDTIARIAPPDAQYAGFNLVVLEPRISQVEDGGGNAVTYDGVFITNGGSGGKIYFRPLVKEGGICGALSNGIDGHGADDWPKVRVGRAALATIAAIPASEETLRSSLFNLLETRGSSRLQSAKDLRQTILVDPVANGRSIYATRLATVLLVTRSGDVLFVERDIFIPGDSENSAVRSSAPDREFRFKLRTDSET